jgi:hypothetical protein
MSDRDRDLAQFFIDRPAEPTQTLQQLIDAYGKAMYSACSAWECAEGTAEDAECDRLRAEIERRLTAVDGFHGSEATRMRAILETGDDKAWWQA